MTGRPPGCSGELNPDFVGKVAEAEDLGESHLHDIDHEPTATAPR